MSRVVFAGLCPHPPIVVPEVGKGSVAKIQSTFEAMNTLALEVRSQSPEVLVLASPHAPVFRGAIGLGVGNEARGSLSSFGVPHVRLRVNLDAPAREETREAAHTAGIPLREFDAELDHGFLIPLYFLERVGLKIPVVLISPGFVSTQALYEMGIQMAQRFQRRTAFIASGDLSHRLTRDAPAGYDPKGKEFDEAVSQALKGADAQRVLDMDDELIDRAGQCALGPLSMLFGIAKGMGAFEVLSYEGPFGVGYMVAQVTSEHYFVRLARRALEAYVREKRVITPMGVPKEAQRKAGAFVSLHSRGELRGCIGTIEPTKDNVALEIVENAISSGTRDPRFQKVRQNELESLTYSVDVLEQPEPISSLDELDPRIYGVVVEKGARRGLLLPDLEGVDTAKEQVAIACQKAGILSREEGMSLYRFKVERYGKKG